MQWHIYLYGIEWDDGKGEYDVSDHPENLRVHVDADSKEDAIERALEEATDEWDTLIASTEQIRATRID
jgi:hypothetical protein